MKVRVYGRLRSIVSEPEIEIHDNVETLRDLLLRLKERFGEPFYRAVVDEASDNIRIGIVLTVNGVGVALEKGLDTKLKGNDEIFIDSIGFVPLEGGG